jgi:hypothetical protein
MAILICFLNHLAMADYPNDNQEDSETLLMGSRLRFSFLCGQVQGFAHELHS